MRVNILGANRAFPPSQSSSLFLNDATHTSRIECKAQLCKQNGPRAYEEVSDHKKVNWL